MDSQQRIQDSQYSFPYHYIPSYSPDISLVKYWSFGINYLATIKLLTSKIKGLPIKSILDVGAGEGRLVVELSKQFPELKVAGIDYSERAIGLAQALNPGINMKVLNILEEDIKETYDCYTLIEVFEHIPVAEATRFATRLGVSIPSGSFLIITVPHRNIKVSQKHAQHFSRESLLGYYEENFSQVEVMFLHKKVNSLRRVFNKLLANRYFILNHKGLTKRMFDYFFKSFFIVQSENQCERILMILKKK